MVVSTRLQYIDFFSAAMKRELPPLIFWMELNSDKKLADVCTSTIKL